MKTKQVAIIVCTLLMSAYKGAAQQDPMISQYMSNGIFINPAYAGTHTYATLSGVYRNQWTNMPGAPKTSFISYDGRVKSSNIGLGVTFINDKIGVSNESQLAGNFTYQIPFANGQLSLGIKAAISYYTAQLTALTVWDPNDQVFMNNINGRWIPNVGTGAYYYTDKFYAGISVPHLLNYSKPSNSAPAEINKVPNYERHYFATSGYVFTLPSDVYLKPSVLIKYVPNAPIEADINMNVFFLNRLMVGGAYRTRDGLVAMTELKVTKKLRFGYAFDWPLTVVNKYTNGTHEFMIAYDFIKDIVTMQSPRFF